MASIQDKKAVNFWQEYRKALIAGTALEHDKSGAEIEKHRLWLEERPFEWMKYMFPDYATCEFADFQKMFIRRVLDNEEWMEILSWARELGKDTIVMMLMFYLNMTGKRKFTLFVSSSNDTAVDLLKPYKINFESNQRIKAYYGDQQSYGDWEVDDFTTKDGVRYVALGAKQNPRGKKNEPLRPDSIIVTDIDTDEKCRNETLVDQDVEWLQGALYFTRSISKSLLFLMLGNIIAKKCAVTEMAKKANHHDIVNIRMVKLGKPDPINDYRYGTSVWPQKNTEEMIDIVLSKVSTRIGMQECFNNPVSEGKIFKEITWGKCPPLNSLPFVINYSDPATSNKDKPTRRSKRSYKASFIIGYKEGKYYIYKGYLDQVSTHDYCLWFYSLKDYVNGRTQLYHFIENMKIQNPFYEQVFVPKFSELREVKGEINITPDTREKPDKAFRIEGTLDPINREGRLVFNIDEKGNPHMERLEEQFKLFDMTLSAPADGPDCIEGGVIATDDKRMQLSPGSVVVAQRPTNKKRY
ncbi:MAG TPA: hypothetical protein PKC47_02065 [Petrimonas sp.]|nr:hypothetical protein [Petrimonas sp.]